MTGLPDPVLSESATENIHGQQVDHTMMPGGHRAYAYDTTGRLTSVTDLDAGTCTVRTYRFDANSNRTGQAAASSAATDDGSGNLTTCPTPSTPAATTSFDTGDRIVTAGYSYDQFGRTTRVPMPGGQVLRVGYHAGDLVASQTLYGSDADADANSGAGTNPLDTSSYTLDVTGQRLATRTAQVTDPGTGVVSTVTRTMRYASSGDSPDWTDEGNGTITRNITGPGGDLAATAIIDKTGATGDQLTWQLADIHGDVAATLPADNTAPIEVNRPDEYGVTGTDAAPRYGWLGAKQRASDTPGGITLMGVRLYNPGTGRFLSTDPVPGGSANAYGYPTDPISQYDLDGRMWNWVKRAFRYSPTRWGPFSKPNKHFVMRDGRPGFHWSNHQSRFEWDSKNKWHVNYEGRHWSPWRFAGRQAWRGLKWSGRHAWSGIRRGARVGGRWAGRAALGLGAVVTTPWMSFMPPIQFNRSIGRTQLS